MIKNTTTLINHLMMNLNKVNIAVDCTLGNGNDAINIINFLTLQSYTVLIFKILLLHKSKENFQH